MQLYFLKYLLIFLKINQKLYKYTEHYTVKSNKVKIKTSEKSGHNEVNYDGWLLIQTRTKMFI